MAKSKYGLDYRAELKEPGSADGDPFIFLNFYEQALPETYISFKFTTTDYDEKFDFAEKLTKALNKIVTHL